MHYVLRLVGCFYILLYYVDLMYRTIKHLIKLPLDLEGDFNCLLFEIYYECTGSQSLRYD